MSVYLIAYDLVNESDYEPLWDELERLGAHKTQYSLWLINSNDTPKEVVEHFSKFVDEDDRIWVTVVRRGKYWYKAALPGTNDWLEENPPD